MELSELAKDKDYLGLPETERAKVIEHLTSNDADFHALPDADKATVLNHLVSLKAPEPSAAPASNLRMPEKQKSGGFKGSVAGGVTQGAVIDPLSGIAQIVQKGLPQSIKDKVATQGAEFGLNVPKGGLDEQLRQGEQQYQNARKDSGNTGLDMPRIGGNIVSGLATSFIPGLQVASGKKVFDLGNMLKTAAQGGLIGAEQPVLQGDFDAEKGKQIAAGATLSGLSQPVSAAIGNGVNASRTALATKKSQNALKDATLKSANESGYTVTPTLAEAGKLPQTIEGLSGSARANQQAILRNQGKSNSLAREYLGLPDNVAISSDVLQTLKKPNNAIYEEVANLPAIKANPGHLGVVPNVTQDGRTVLEELKQTRFDAKDYHNHAYLTGDPASAKTARALDIKAKDLEATLEKMAQNSGNADLLNRFREARKNLAKINTIDNVTNGATGDIDAIALAKLKENGVPLDGSALKIANFANAYKDLARSPRAGMGADFTAVDAGLAAGGLGSGNGLIASLPLGRVFGRKAVLSKPVQDAMANKQYGVGPTKKLAELLFANPSSPAAMSGALLPLLTQD